MPETTTEGKIDSDGIPAEQEFPKYILRYFTAFDDGKDCKRMVRLFPRSCGMHFGAECWYP